ncbi:MAG: sulfotransferase [Halioglobus sp.]|nr:sulfotransferase [Halioglobus sp.]
MKLKKYPLLEIRLRRYARSVKESRRKLTALGNPWLKEIKPDFLGVGAPRAGSTWMHNKLSLHPQLFLPHEKEVHFFDILNAEGRYRFDVQSPQDRRWYATYFLRAGSRIKGEITPAYSILPRERVREIVQFLPGVKIIYILRDPIERAWSGIRRRCWYSKGRSADLCDVDDLVELAGLHDVLVRGDYRRNIEIWESEVQAQNIKYIFFEDINDNGKAVLCDVCKFLDVEPDLLNFSEENQNAVNQAPQSQIPQPVEELLKKSYLPDREFLEEKFGRDLSSWYS